MSPLSGVKVIDFSQIMLGPCCTQMLGDFGADVIKIERPIGGDLSRTSVVDQLGLDNPIFLSLNRNKRSIALDAHTEVGKQIVYDLVRDADVVVNNFRPGVMERMGFGYDDLARINPRVIWAFGSGFGSSGPYVYKGGQDIIAQAYSGVMHRKANPDDPLTIYPTALADYSAGMHLVQGILLSLLQRAKTGVGQKVEVSLYNSMLSMQMQEATMYLMRNRDQNWAAYPLTGVFETADSAIVLVGAFKENPLRDICLALGIPDFSLEERFDGLANLFKNRPEIQSILRERFVMNTTEHWLAKLEEQDLLCAPVKTMVEALADPQTAHNGMLLEFEYSNGEEVHTLAPPISMSGSSFSVRHIPPKLGEHYQEILEEIGYGSEKINAAKEAGVIKWVQE